MTLGWIHASRKLHKCLINRLKMEVLEVKARADEMCCSHLHLPCQSINQSHVMVPALRVHTHRASPTQVPTSASLRPPPPPPEHVRTQRTACACQPDPFGTMLSREVRVGSLYFYSEMFRLKQATKLHRTSEEHLLVVAERECFPACSHLRIRTLSKPKVPAARASRGAASCP